LLILISWAIGDLLRFKLLGMKQKGSKVSDKHAATISFHTPPSITEIYIILQIAGQVVASENSVVSKINEIKTKPPWRDSSEFRLFHARACILTEVDA
jgi:hypothetical protein